MWVTPSPTRMRVRSSSMCWGARWSNRRRPWPRSTGMRWISSSSSTPAAKGWLKNRSHCYRWVGDREQLIGARACNALRSSVRRRRQAGQGRGPRPRPVGDPRFTSSKGRGCLCSERVPRRVVAETGECRIEVSAMRMSHGISVTPVKGQLVSANENSQRRIPAALVLVALAPAAAIGAQGTNATATVSLDVGV